MNTPENKSLINNRLRVYARVEVPGEAIIHDENGLYIAPLNNLSAGGCFVEQLNCFPEGSEVTVVVRSQRLKSPIQARGVVVRVENKTRVGTAIEFVSINQESRDTVQTLVYENKLQNAFKIV